MTGQPNLLFVMADQMRADALGVVNGWSRTPHLDRLAGEGVLVRGMISNSAECVPARLSLAAGQYPHQTGCDENVACTLSPAFPNWMQAVEAAGYRTAVFGKTHLHPHRGDLRERVHLLHAYGLQVVEETAGPHASAHVASAMTDEWSELGLWERYREDVVERVRTGRHVSRPSPLGVEHHYDTWVGRRAARFLAGVAADRPWFCWVGFGGPHEPWDAPEPYASLHRLDEVPPPLPRLRDSQRIRGLLRRGFDSPLTSPGLEPELVRALRRDYAGKVALIDDQVGALLAVVRQRGEAERTLVLFTSDHGEMNGDQGLLYKANFLDPVIQLPLVVRPPASSGVRPGRRVDTVAELMDVGATLVDYAGGRLPAPSLARSLRAVIEGETAACRDVAVCEFRGHTAVVDSDWKLEVDPGGEPVLLFDRRRDPAEQEDVLGDARHAGVVAALRERLAEHVAATPAPRERVATVER